MPRALLRQAHGVRDSANKAGLDVSTLDDLLDRLDTYDAALVDLYTILEASNGETTDASRAALARVNAAQESLPTDQAAMVIIISDLAGPTITPVLLSIESARGALEPRSTLRHSRSDAAPPPRPPGPVRYLWPVDPSRPMACHPDIHRRRSVLVPSAHAI